MHTRSVSVDRIRVATNDRERFDESELRQLADSIQREGLLAPLVLRRVGQELELVAGERRLRAVRLLGWSTVPARITEMDEHEAARAMLAENLQRVQLDPIEEAKAYQKRLESAENVAEVAREAGVNAGRVNSRLALLRLLPELQSLVASRQMPMGHAACMSQLDQNRQQIAMRAFLATERMPTEQEFRTVCSRLLEQQLEESLFDDVAEFMAAEQTLAASQSRPEPSDVPGPDRRLPAFTGAGNVDEAMRRYHERLRQDGFESEARVVATIWAGLRASNLAPPKRQR